MKLSKTHARIAVAAAATVAGLAVLPTKAAPLLNIQVLGSTTNPANGTPVYTSSLTGISNGTTIYYEVVAQSAATGITNSNKTSGTTTPDGSHDLLTTFPALQLYNGTSSTNETGNGVFTASALGSTWTSGTGSSPGTTGNSTITIYGTVSGGTPDDSRVLLATGSYQLGSSNSVIGINDLLVGSQPGNKTGSIRLGTSSISGTVGINTTTENTSDPVVGATGLVFNDVWDGNASGNWDTSSLNFNNHTAAFTNGAGAVFGNYAADGVTPVQNNGSISIAAGGVSPSSVTFSNSSLTYRLADADGTNGIKGATSVTISGGGTVILISPNTYGGGTTITSGTLRATTGSLLSTGNLTIGAAGKLGIGDGVALTPSTLTTGAETWAGNGTLMSKLDDGSTADLLIIGGNLTLSSVSSNAPFKIVASQGDVAPNLTTSHAWEIADINGTLAGYAGTTPNLAGVDPGAQFSLDTSAFGATAGTFSLSLVQVNTGHEQLFLDYNVTPEPGTAMLLLGGAVPMFMGRRRRTARTATAAEGN